MDKSSRWLNMNYIDGDFSSYRRHQWMVKCTFAKCCREGPVPPLVFSFHFVRVMNGPLMIWCCPCPRYINHLFAQEISNFVAWNQKKKTAAQNMIGNWTTRIICLLRTTNDKIVLLIMLLLYANVAKDKISTHYGTSRKKVWFLCSLRIQSPLGLATSFRRHRSGR